MWQQNLVIFNNLGEHRTFSGRLFIYPKVLFCAVYKALLTSSTTKVWEGKLEDRDDALSMIIPCT